MFKFSHSFVLTALFSAAIVTTTGQSARAEIASAPACDSSVISITVDDASTLSSAAVIELDGTAMSGTHTLSNGDKTISATHASACEDINVSAISVVDGSTTHQ